MRITAGRPPQSRPEKFLSKRLPTEVVVYLFTSLLNDESEYLDGFTSTSERNTTGLEPVKCITTGSSIIFIKGHN